MLCILEGKYVYIVIALRVYLKDTPATDTEMYTICTTQCTIDNKGLGLLPTHQSESLNQ